MSAFRKVEVQMRKEDLLVAYQRPKRIHFQHFNEAGVVDHRMQKTNKMSFKLNCILLAGK